MGTQDSIHDIPTLINQFITTADDENISERYSKELSELIEKDEMTLLQFIQSLGPRLTADNDIVRTKSIQCLAATMKLLGPAKLSKQDINVLLEFLLAKFEDKLCLVHVLSGLNSLILFNNFIFGMNSNIEKILSSISNNYDPKKHLAKVRHEPFQTLNLLLTNGQAYFQSNATISDLFAKTFIHVASGEKDPRNLLLSFDINKKINVSFDFDPLNETHKDIISELYDVCFCYFPISFTPPPNDPYMITAQDLKLKLRSTISSQSLFAKDSFNDLIEKLTSTNPVVRNDVLKTLLACVENYQLETVVEYWVTIWNALKFEILHNDVSIFKPYMNTIIPDNYDEEIDDSDEFKPLITTLVIIQKLSKQMSEFDQMENFLTTISHELESNLVDLNNKTFKQSVLLLSVLASDSVVGFNFIIKFFFTYDIWGKFINNYDTDQDEGSPIEEDKNEDLILNVSKQRELIDNLGFVLTSYNVLTASLKDSDEFIENNNLKMYKDHLLIFLGQLLQTSSNLEKTLKCKVIQQLIKLSQLQGLLNRQECDLILGYFNHILIGNITSGSKSWEKDLVVREIVNGMIKLMSADDNSDKTAQVIELILPNLLELLSTTKSDFNKILNIIGEICINYQFLEILSIRLLNKLSSYDESETHDFGNFKGILNLLVESIKKIQNSKQFLMNSWYKNFIPRLITSVLKSLKVKEDHVIIELCGDLIGLIIKFNDKSKHQGILNDFVCAFILNKPNSLNFNEDIINNINPLINLFNKALANVDKTSKIELKEDFTVNALLENIIKLCSTASDDYPRLGYLQNLCLLTNKFTISNDYVETRLQELFEEILNVSDSSMTLTQSQIEHFEVMVWIIKSLILKIDKVGISYVDKFVSLLSVNNRHVQQLAARSFGILMVDLPIFTNQQVGNKTKLISEVQNLNVRLLYKQKIFGILLPKLIEGYNESNESNKENYLISLSLILNNVSHSILKAHLSEILPLVLNGLSLQNPTILQASLTTLEIIIDESQNLITPQLSSLIPKLVGLSVSKIVIHKKLINNEEIRLLSLMCLQKIFTTVELQYIIPYQKSALNELVAGLDDKKRNIRKLCGDVRQALFELGK